MTDSSLPTAPGLLTSGQIAWEDYAGRLLEIIDKERAAVNLLELEAAAGRQRLDENRREIDHLTTRADRLTLERDTNQRIAEDALDRAANAEDKARGLGLARRLCDACEGDPLLCKDRCLSCGDTLGATTE